VFSSELFPELSVTAEPATSGGLDFGGDLVRKSIADEPESPVASPALPPGFVMLPAPASFYEAYRQDRDNREREAETAECNRIHRNWVRTWIRDRERRMAEGEVFYEPEDPSDLYGGDSSDDDGYEMDETEHFGSSGRAYD